MGKRKFNWMIQSPGVVLTLVTMAITAFTTGIDEYKKIRKDK
jgi:hypothetical protein